MDSRLAAAQDKARAAEARAAEMTTALEGQLSSLSRAETQHSTHEREVERRLEEAEKRAETLAEKRHEDKERIRDLRAELERATACA